MKVAISSVIGAKPHAEPRTSAHPGSNADLPFEEGIFGDRQVNGYESQQLQRDARPYPGRAELRPAVADVEAGHRVKAEESDSRRGEHEPVESLDARLELQPPAHQVRVLAPQYGEAHPGD